MDEIKQAVLENVFDICQNDADYLWHLIEWAHRDYTDADYQDDYNTMGLGE